MCDTGLRRLTDRSNSEAGSAVLEFALILPLMAILTFGTFTGAISYNRKIALSSASREAARYATTHGTPTATSLTDSSSAGWLPSVATVAETNAQGELNPGTSGRDICVMFVAATSSNLAQQAYKLDWTTTDSGTVTSGSTGAVSCSGATTPTQTSDNQVEVVVHRSASIDAVAFQIPVTLNGTGFGRVEQ